MKELEIPEVKLDLEASIVDCELECGRQSFHLLVRFDERDSFAFDVHILLQLL